MYIKRYDLYKISAVYKATNDNKKFKEEQNRKGRASNNIYNKKEQSSFTEALGSVINRLL